MQPRRGSSRHFFVSLEHGLQPQTLKLDASANAYFTGLVHLKRHISSTNPLHLLYPPPERKLFTSFRYESKLNPILFPAHHTRDRSIMATDSVAASMNGSYGSQQAYGTNEAHPSTQTSNSTAGSATSGTYGAQNGNVPSATNSAPSGTEENSNSVSKDEVGWYFVEQYYTTLSRSPEKLHVSCIVSPPRRIQADSMRMDQVHWLTMKQLFYSKRSQFVSGVEAEKVTVYVGQRVSVVKSSTKLGGID